MALATPAAQAPLPAAVAPNPTPTVPPEQAMVPLEPPLVVLPEQGSSAPDARAPVRALAETDRTGQLLLIVLGSILIVLGGLMLGLHSRRMREDG